MSDPTAKLRAFLEKIAPWLVPPLQGHVPFIQAPEGTKGRESSSWEPNQEPWKSFVLEVKVRIPTADSVALFLVAQDDPNTLKFAAAVGYKRDVGDYFLHDLTCATAYAARSKRIIVGHPTRLQDKDGTRIPFSARCEKQRIEKLRRFPIRTVCVLPLRFQDTVRGVLRLESHKPRAFERYQKLLEGIAATIGLASQQRFTQALWDEGKRHARACPDVASYVQSVAATMAKLVNAECAAVFLNTPASEDELAYVGGVGYKPEYRKKTYRVNKSRRVQDSLTAHVAATGQEICHTEKQLLDDKVPYTGACASYIGRPLRSILALKIMTPDGSNPRYVGVIKCENRIDAESFDDHDLRMARAFVASQLVPTLQKLGSTGHSTVPLEKAFGGPAPDVRRDSKAWQERLRSVHQMQQRKKVTAKQAAAYLGIGKATYHRKVRAFSAA